MERTLVEYVADFQGIEPPSSRGEEFCDAATKTHFNDTPAYYYNYAFATVFKFQLHDYIARHILLQPPQSCNYADNKEVGTWLLARGGESAMAHVRRRRSNLNSRLRRISNAPSPWRSSFGRVPAFTAAIGWALIGSFSPMLS